MFVNEEKDNFNIHTIITLVINQDIYPFIIGIYKHDISEGDKNKLINYLENLQLRIRLIGTKAYITYRLNDVYKKFIENGEINPIIELIDKLKTIKEWWWAHWNNEKLEESLRGYINSTTAKFLLWKYENHLVGKGYNLRYNIIEEPNLEHITPKTEPWTKPHGYEYTEPLNEYIECLGNYLLLSESHNKSI